MENLSFLFDLNSFQKSIMCVFNIYLAFIRHCNRSICSLLCSHLNYILGRVTVILFSFATCLRRNCQSRSICFAMLCIAEFSPSLFECSHRLLNYVHPFPLDDLPAGPSQNFCSAVSYQFLAERPCCLLCECYNTEVNEPENPSML